MPEAILRDRQLRQTSMAVTSIIISDPKSAHRSCASG